MSMDGKPERELEERIASRVMDVFIRIGMVLALALLCYRALSPFLTLLIWSLILAVALYPLHDAVARKVGGRHGLAATLIAILGLALIVAPTAVLMSSLGDSVHQFIHNVQNEHARDPGARPSPWPGWPVVGPQVHSLWSQAYRSAGAGPEHAAEARGHRAGALGFVAGIGVGLLQFLASFIIAGILMAFGEAGERGSRRSSIGWPARRWGEEFAKLSTATIRAVAQGVIGVAFIQAIIIGVCLLVAGIPWAACWC